MRLATPIFLLLLLLCCSKPTPAPEQHAADRPDRRSLIRKARAEGNWLWVYSAADAAAATAYRTLLEPMAADSPFERPVRLVSADSVSAEDLARHPVILFGTHFPEPWQARLNQIESWQRHPASFAFAGETFADERDLLAIFYYPNPWNPEWPLHVLAANSDTQLLRHLQENYGGDASQLAWSSWGYTVRRAGRTRLLGYFADSTWQLDRRVHFAFSAGADTLATRPEAVWIGENYRPQPGDLDRLVAEYRERRDSLSRFLGKPVATRPIFHLYPSVENKGLQLQNMEPAQADLTTADVHWVVNDYFRGDQWGEDMRLLLRQSLGQPNRHALESGLALHFTPAWGQGRGYRYWASRLWQSDNAPSLNELLDNELLAKESSWVFPPLAGALVDFLLQRYGRAAFLEQYDTWQPPKDSLPALERAWTRFMDREYKAIAPPPFRFGPRQFLHGFTFAHEGYRVYNGYGSAAARTSLTRLTSLGTDAISIVPYSYMRNHREPTYLPIVRQAGTENDAATLFSHFTVKSMGQFSLLKPQIWIRGSWPGDVDFATEAEWDAFFDYYYRWMRHYAMLAEMFGFDGLVVGTELVQSTLQYPDRWRDMIRRWRGLYRGTTTYAANWGAEFEQLTFWNKLDVIGCNCYYPLSDKATPTDVELHEGARAMLDRVNNVSIKHARTVWLTEIGYRSVTAPWQQPHAAAGERAAAPADQARAYRALWTALQAPSAVKGLFIWKWPSILSDIDRGGTGFRPLDKPAEEVVRAWYIE